MSIECSLYWLIDDLPPMCMKVPKNGNCQPQSKQKERVEAGGFEKRANKCEKGLQRNHGKKVKEVAYYAMLNDSNTKYNSMISRGMSLFYQVFLECLPPYGLSSTS